MPPGEPAPHIVIPEPLVGARPIVFTVTDGRTAVTEAPPVALINLSMIGRAAGGGLEVNIVFPTDGGTLVYRVVGATLDGVLVCEKVGRAQRRRKERRGG